MPSEPEIECLRWYLIHCKPREDERALAHLQRQGFQCYWPVRRVERLRQGHRFTTQEALFPRYLFIRLDRLHDSWYSIRSTRGVHEIVRSAGQPAAVRDEIIEGIRARLEDPLWQEPYLRPGERVRITEGAFSQLEAIFVAHAGDERVVLLLNILQKDQRVSFPLRSVQRVG